MSRNKKVLTDKVTRLMLAAIAESLSFRLAGEIDEDETTIPREAYADAYNWIATLIERIEKTP